LPARTRTECGGRAKVSNELSNYCGADPQPPLDDPGRFGAPGIGIDDHLACFTPKQSETHAWSLRMPCRRLLRTKPGNADHFQLLVKVRRPAIIWVHPRTSLTPAVASLRCRRSLTRKRSLVRSQYRPQITLLVRSTFERNLSDGRAGYVQNRRDCRQDLEPCGST
jgi:hypothetical protein